jgi:Raf kinase inhibitor-like YbhB/YbcL family protein
MKLTSSSFEHNRYIPSGFTCEGKNVSPSLCWQDLPQGTITIAIICDDPDAPSGTFTHWIIWNIPPSQNSLPQAIPNQGELKGGIRQGRGSSGLIGYFGPCPPLGKPHHYNFTLYALDTSLDLTVGIPKGKLLEAMSGHIREHATLTGLFAR